MHMAKRIALYNTLTRKKEILKPLRKDCLLTGIQQYIIRFSILEWRQEYV